ncbi:hypothetical protein FHS23_000559 [Prauserella isguenensis]|uniref:Uncharacterized protein n=1 Tax=Prauserella isguenensis TaxID=1470180 RepID=A0A839RWY5_9PSEU|nr:DUF6474 family protein [Prauserella isguenensis]MBB3049564.1 hypothetical protein [Prauserella isguenensis]
MARTSRNTGHEDDVLSEPSEPSTFPDVSESAPAKSKKAAKKERKAAKKAAKSGEHESGLTPQKAKNAVKVAKIVIPAVGPALVPLAVRAAGTVREAYDRYQARKIGVPVEQLSEYSGHGGGLLARIAGAADGLAELRRAPQVTDDDVSFAQHAQGTLEQLTASVRAAEHMPSTRRKAAHKAIASELDNLESELLRRLGVA